MMTSQKLEQIFLWGIRILLAFVPFLPLYVSSSLLFPYISGRNFAFRILVEIAFVLWLGLITLSKKYRPELSLIMKAVLVFIGIVFIADIFGADFWRSFWSNFERMEGFLTIIHMVVFFLVVASVFREWEWKIFAHLVVAASVGVGAYALYQKLGYARSIQGGVRVDGTIGNPTYLAVYLMLAFFVACLLVWHAKKIWQRWVYGVIITFDFLIIYFTASRGVILGLLFGALVFSILFLIIERKNAAYVLYRTIAWGVLGVAIAVPLIFFAIKNLSFVASSPVLSRFASISLTERTTQSRFIIWRDVALRGIKEHPILGWGQENFNLIFNKYYDPRLWPQEPWFDRSHDIIFDWLSNAGIAGLLSYLSMFGAALLLLWRTYRRGVLEVFPAVLLTAMFAAYFFQNLFVFDNFNSYFLFFGFLGYIHFLAHHMDAGENNTVSIPKDFSRSLTTVFIAGICMVLVMYMVNIRPINQGITLIEALQSAGSGNADPKKLNDVFKSILFWGTLADREIVEQYSRFANQVFDIQQIPQETRVSVLKDAIQAMERQVEQTPDDIRYRLFLASTGYMRMASIDGQYIPKAEQEYLKVIELSQKKQTAYEGLVQLYLSTSRYNDAFRYAEKLYNLDSEFPDAQLFYTVAAVYLNRFDIAQRIVANAPALHQPPLALNVLNTYAMAKRFDLMAPLYVELIKNDPENAQYHASLAAVYAELRDFDNAEREAKEAVRIDPKTYQAELGTFLQKIGR